MTEKIQLYLNEILQKAQHVHALLEVERKKNNELEQKVAALQSELDSKYNLEVSLRSEVDELKASLESAKNTKVEVPSTAPIGKRNEEIDELVKEIEYCIEQLKQ